MNAEWLNTGRAKLASWSCAGLAVAWWALVLVWLISDDLQWETAVATALLAGIALLARSSRFSTVL